MMGFSQVGNVTLFGFSASQLGIHEQVISPGRTVPHGPTEVLSLSGAAAALNGPQYDLCNGGTDATSQCDIVDFLQFDGSRGVNDPGTRPGQGITISIVNGTPQVMPGGVMTPGASVAVQLWPPLVTGGQNVTNASLNTDVVWRSALCVMNDGSMAFAVGMMAMSDFADALVAAGAVTAGYTDGGGSSSLVVPGAVVGSSEGRRVASWLVVNQGNPFVMFLGIGAIVAGAWLLWRTVSRA
jgi:phosphodiester glycosidase